MSENCSILSINFYSVYIFSYFAINNVDYRLLWLGIAIILDSQFYLQNSIQNKVLYSLILLSFFVVYPVGYHQIFGILPLQVIGDFTLHILTIIVTARLYLLLGNLKAFGK
jgi:hypothetical protein